MLLSDVELELIILLDSQQGAGIVVAGGASLTAANCTVDGWNGNGYRNAAFLAILFNADIRFQGPG
jgi:hypothetical protein